MLKPKLPNLPFEVIEMILIFLVTENDDPVASFKVVNSLNRFFRNGSLRDRIINNVPNFDIANAARQNHLKIVEWRYQLRNRRLLKFDTEQVVVQATQSGQIDILKWMKDNNISLRTKISVLKLAMIHRQSKTYEWWKLSGELLVY